MQNNPFFTKKIGVLAKTTQLIKRATKNHLLKGDNSTIKIFKQVNVNMNNLTLFVVVFITGLTLVLAALAIAKLIAPRSYNPQKGDAYECGMTTRGESWMQFRVGYYLFAILFLMFDVETVFLFPWAVVVKEMGVSALISVSFFLAVLIMGLAYAWKKGALEWK